MDDTTANLVTIANFYGHKRAALSYTFDDGLQSQLDYAVPALNAYAFKGTFNIIAGLTRACNADPPLSATHGLAIGSWESWVRVAAQGHEIGNHSYSHADMLALADPRLIEQEVHLSADICTAKIGRPPLTFAYPFTHYNPQIDDVVLTRHIAIRLNEAGFGSELATVAAMNGAVAAAIREGRWLAPMLHGFQAGEYGAVIEPDFSRHLSFTHAHLADLWVDTYANVSRYLQEWGSAEIEMITASARRLTFTLSCPLDPTIFNHPLTLCIATGSPCLAGPVATLTRNGLQLPVTINDGDIMLEVIPGAGTVDVRWE